MNINYQKICNDILKDLPQKRTKDVLERRFGLKQGETRETLESIGKSYGITRERVRQIEEDGLKKARAKAKIIAQEAFQDFRRKLQDCGNLKKEESLLEELGGKKLKNQVFFLLTLGNEFIRILETEDFHSFWTINHNSFDSVQKTVTRFKEELKKKSQPISLEKANFANLNKEVLSCYIDVSKQIGKGSQGLYGLCSWPEINPKGIKDKAFLAIKKENQPLHFTKVAEIIEKEEKEKKPCLVKTVHNELIKDPRFILVGRGLYALKEWGYKPGIVREVIKDVIQNSSKPLSSNDIVNKVSSQRFVQKNTILLNLQNKKYFSRDSQGKYFVKEA